MSERQCCACGRETCVAVVAFPLLREGYPVGPECHAAWRREAQSLGGAIYNPAKVHMTFLRWLASRAEVVA